MDVIFHVLFLSMLVHTKVRTSKSTSLFFVVFFCFFHFKLIQIFLLNKETAGDTRTKNLKNIFQNSLN